MNPALNVLMSCRAQRPRVVHARNDDLAQAVAAFNIEHDILSVFAGRDLKRTGKEYHGPCPLCAGEDRFCVWPDKGRAWCRKCQTSGDALRWSMLLAGRDPELRGATAHYLRDLGHLSPREPQSSPALARYSPEANLGHATVPPVAVYDADWFEERAAILEYDGGFARDVAERMAAAELAEIQRREAGARA